MIGSIWGCISRTLANGRLRVWESYLDNLVEVEVFGFGAFLHNETSLSVTRRIWAGGNLIINSALQSYQESGNLHHLIHDRV